MCNMDSPLCFSTAGPGFSLTLEDVEAMLDDFVRTEGTPEVVQVAGGEPTIHPQIIDVVKAAKARGIRFVMINTNGKRVARDDKFVEQLAEVNSTASTARPGSCCATTRTSWRRRFARSIVSPRSVSTSPSCRPSRAA